VQEGAIYLLLSRGSKGDRDFGYQRSYWSTELLALQINTLFSTAVVTSTIRHWLFRVGIVWRRPARHAIRHSLPASDPGGSAPGVAAG